MKTFVNLQSLVASVEAYVQERLGQYIEELRELCAVDSYSYHKAGLDSMAVLLAARMRGLGMQTEVVQRETWGNDLVGISEGDGGGNVLLLGHIDTVYPVGIAAQRPLRIENDVVFGPGVCDMKGCILAAIYAVEALHALNFREYGELRFLCVSDEEINTRHSKDLIKSLSRNAQGALVLEAARSNGDIVSARKGHTWFTLTARGRSAHAGVEPEQGRNAIVELSHQIMQVQQLNGWREGITVNAGVINGGTMPNVVPDFAQVQFDVRFLTNDDLHAIEQRFRAFMEDRLVPDVELTLEVAPDGKGPMVRTPGTLKLAQQAQSFASMLGFSLNHVLTGGASDASYTFGYGVPTLDGLGPIGGRDHSPYEYLELNSVAPRAALLAGLIASIGMEQV